MKCRLRVSGVIAQDDPKLTEIDWSKVQQDREALWHRGVSIYGCDDPAAEIDPDQCLYSEIILTARAVADFYLRTNGWEDTFLPDEYEWMRADRGEPGVWIKEGNVWVGLTDTDVYEHGEAIE